MMGKSLVSAKKTSIPRKEEAVSPNLISGLAKGQQKPVTVIFAGLFFVKDRSIYDIYRGFWENFVGSNDFSYVHIRLLQLDKAALFKVYPSGHGRRDVGYYCSGTCLDFLFLPEYYEGSYDASANGIRSEYLVPAYCIRIGIFPDRCCLDNGFDLPLHPENSPEDFDAGLF